MKSRLYIFINEITMLHRSSLTNLILVLQDSSHITKKAFFDNHFQRDHKISSANSLHTIFKHTSCGLSSNQCMHTNIRYTHTISFANTIRTQFSNAYHIISFLTKYLHEVFQHTQCSLSCIQCLHTLSKCE